MLALPAVAVLAALSLAACATLPNGQRWGGDVTVAPGWARLRAAAVRAAADPWVWAPLAGAAALQVGNFDHRLSRWGRGARGGRLALSDSFMGLDARRERFGFSPLPGGGVLTFAVALKD